MQARDYHSHLTLPAIQAALKAGNILRQGFGSKFTVTSKESLNDVVTEYDREAEEAIINYLSDIFPTHSFLAEESGRSQVHTGDVHWIIDPLDGTMNFAHHIPLFCVSIAAMVADHVEVGVIYDPLLDELFVAERGFGAYLNHKPIHVSPLQDIKRAVLATGFPFDASVSRENCIDQFIKFLENENPIRLLGSAALTLAYIAAGRFDIYWGTNLKPWDVAAGNLLITEAGGMISHFDGTAHDIFRTSNTLATNAYLHAHALTILK
ncbi:MAG TPA: inositol monophosphatase family protein [Parachlamydiaceae bacterium]|nr:inositol monophosphatase family protein [Parachlamydiaceae bacterium]